MLIAKLPIAFLLAAALLAAPRAALACAAGEMVADGVKYVGYVFDERGKPVSGATVLVTQSNKELKVGPDGRYDYVEHIPADTPSILFVCKKPGFASAQAVKKVSPYEPRLILVTCTLKPQG